MLKRADIELLTADRAGHADGRGLSRSGYRPAPERAARADCAPIRLTMLSEKLIAFRDSAGKSVSSRRTARTAAPAVLRSERRYWSALRLPRLEVRHLWALASICPTSLRKATSSTRSR